MIELDEEVINKTDIKDDEKIEEPKDHHLIFWNDDFTPMDLVVLVLKKFCNKSDEEANKLMLEVHNKGKAIAWTGTYDIACTKQIQILNVIKSMGFPLKITVEES